LPPDATDVPAPARKINLNTAPLAELDLLPGVGVATAQAIVDYRTRHGPFRTVSDLDKVPGIGPSKLNRLRDLVTVD
jgi:competence protein ComEA